MVGTHIGGYSAFRFDITPFVQFGSENLICLQVTNRIDAELAPIRADSTSFGGILKETSLIIVDPVHFELNDFGSKGVYAAVSSVCSDMAELTLSAKIRNDSDQPTIATAWIRLADAAGCTVAEAPLSAFIDSASTATATGTLTVPSPHLWQGKNASYLYTVSCALSVDGTLTDCVTFDCGIRTIAFDPDKGFLLNGKAYPLHGVSYSHDRLGKGRAISKADMEEDLALLREIGAAGIRCPLYAPSDYFLTLCDREGILVSLEIPVTNSVSNAEKFFSTTKSQLIELIRQAYNHPCVVTYGIANEIVNGGLDDSPAPDPAPVLSRLNDVIHAEDPHRFSHICANREVNTSSNFISDVTGWNIYNGWYGGEHEGDIESAAPRFDAIRKNNPGKCIGFSEFGPGASIRYHSSCPLPLDYSEEYQSKYHEFYYKFIQSRPYLCFAYSWLLCDFACDARTECETPGQNNKGFVTFDRKTKKDVFYWYKANWSQEKFVHLTSSRFSPRPLSANKFRAYSNCSTVEFFVNGISQGRVSSPDKIFELDATALVEGYNRIAAVAYSPDSTPVSDEYTAYFSKDAPPFLQPDASH